MKNKKSCLNGLVKMNDKEKYKKIMFELINKNFTKLKKRKIFLISSKFQKGNVSAAVFPFGFFDCIVIFPLARKYSINSLKALLAHELSHCELLVKMNPLQKINFAFSWAFTKKGKRNFERDTDKYVIKKGFKKELLELTKASERRIGKEGFRKRSKKGYLSSKQIKNYRGN